MKSSMILCRFGESVLKADYTRRYFENKLLSNISKEFKKKDIEFSVKREPGRLFIKTKKIDKSCDILKKTFGITSVSPVKEIKIKSDIEKIVKYSEKIARDLIKKDNTFAVRARRTGNDAFTSKMIERKVGSRIIEKTGAKVDLDKPDKILYIEVRQNKAYFFTERIKCPGGLPLGTQGNVVVLFSGGIDSAVASWMLMKRGCRIFPLYIDPSPYVEGKKSLIRAEKVLEDLKKWSVGQNIELKKVKTGKIMDCFTEKCKLNLTCLLCKRLMYRIAEIFCKKKKAKAIVTGENLGQVASQTLDNINVLNQAVSLPILRPLIGMDKTEIIKIARNIGTYDSSTIKTSGCSAVPESPRTKGRIEEVLKEEEKIDIKKKMEELLKM